MSNSQIITEIDGKTAIIPIGAARLGNRIIDLTGPVNDDTAYDVMMQIEYLAELSDEDIVLNICSPGGSVAAGMMIIDAVSACPCDVKTIARGSCCSMGAVIASCGTKGKRLVSPGCEIMIHQPSAGTGGMVSDMERNVEHFKKVKGSMNAILARNTGKTPEKIEEDTDRDLFLTAEEAIAYGLADGYYTGRNE